MALILEVTSYKGVPPHSPLSARFDESGGSIGRSFDNHLALPDEDKVVSRHHGEIRFENGVFVYGDSSTGGTLLCNENRLLENGSSTTLADGDQLKVGEYELRVRIEAESQQFPGLFSGLGDNPALGNPNAQHDFDLNIPPLFSDRETSPLLAEEMPSPRPPIHESDSFINQPDAPSFQANFTPPGIQPIHDDFSFDGILRDEPVLPHSATAKTDDFGFSDDWFGDLGLEPGVVGKAPSPPPEPPQHSTPLPEAKDSVFPEPPPGAVAGDVNQNFLDVLEPAPLVLERGGKGPAHPSGGMDQTILNAPVGGKPSIGQVEFGLKVANAELGQFAETPTPAINLPQPGRPIPPAGVAVSAPAADLSPPVSQSPTPSRAAEVARVVDLFQCFLEGAGLTDGFPSLTQEEQAKAMKSVGQVYREMVDGMMRVLLARKMEKSMIALHQTDVTQYRRGEYNPLKVFPTVEETMEEMVCQKNRAYIGPAEAAREGFADIMNHQMAMRAGMQAAMSGFLKRVDPKTFEEMFKEGIVFQKKTKCWDAYGKAYPKLVEEAMDDLFGESFAEAYREQLRILRQPKQGKG